MKVVITPCPRIRHEPLRLPFTSIRRRTLEDVFGVSRNKLIQRAIDSGKEVARAAGKCLRDEFQIRSAMNTKPALDRVITSAYWAKHRLSFGTST